MIFHCVFALRHCPHHFCMPCTLVPSASLPTKMMKLLPHHFFQNPKNADVYKSLVHLSLRTSPLYLATIAVIILKALIKAIFFTLKDVMDIDDPREPDLGICADFVVVDNPSCHTTVTPFIVILICMVLKHKKEIIGQVSQLA